MPAAEADHGLVAVRARGVAGRGEAGGVGVELAEGDRRAGLVDPHRGGPRPLRDAQQERVRERHVERRALGERLPQQRLRRGPGGHGSQPDMRMLGAVDAAPLVDAPPSTVGELAAALGLRVAELEPRGVAYAYAWDIHHELPPDSVEALARRALTAYRLPLSDADACEAGLRARHGDPVEGRGPPPLRALPARRRRARVARRAPRPGGRGAAACLARRLLGDLLVRVEVALRALAVEHRRALSEHDRRVGGCVGHLVEADEAVPGQ